MRGVLNDYRPHPDVIFLRKLWMMDELRRNFPPMESRQRCWRVKRNGWRSGWMWCDAERDLWWAQRKDPRVPVVTKIGGEWGGRGSYHCHSEMTADSSRERNRFKSMTATRWPAQWSQKSPIGGTESMNELGQLVELEAEKRRERLNK